MKLKDLEAIIKTKINYRYNGEEKRWNYDGFDMSGFNDANYKNMEILSRFSDYLKPIDQDDWRKPTFHFVHFWKGSGSIFQFDFADNTKEIEDVSGDATCTIIRKLILLQNPNILDR